MTRILIPLLVVAVGCEPTTDDPTAEQAVFFEDFEQGLPSEGLNLVDHTTDGGSWDVATVSAWGTGSQSARLSDGEQGMKPGYAVIAIPSLDLVEPAVLTVDLAYASRPFNSEQRLEVWLTAETGDSRVEFTLDHLTDLMLGDGMGSFVPTDTDWFSIEVELDPDELGTHVQATMRVAEDFSGLRPELYVDNVSIAPR